MPGALRAPVLAARQRQHMGVDAEAEGVDVIAAFQHRDDSAAAALVGDLHQPLGRVAEINFAQPQAAERIALMGVEAG